MKTRHEANNLPDASPPALEDDVRIAQLQAECARLRQRVAELETERTHDHQRLVEFESERDQYRAEAYAWARKAFEQKGLPSEEELKPLVEREDGVPLEAFVGELERVAKGS